MPLSTTFRVHSVGRLNEWNSILDASKVCWIILKCGMSAALILTFPFVNAFAVILVGLKFGSL